MALVHSKSILVSLGVILATGILIIIRVLVARPEPNEPEYNGQKLSYWIDKSARFLADDGDPEAVAAVRQIGTNGIPWLLKSIRSDSYLWNKLDRTAYRLPSFPGRQALLQEFAKRSSAGNRAGSRGRAGFHILGREAAVAIPELSHIVKHSSSPAPAAAWAARSLASLGKDALPPLVEVVSNRKQGRSNRYEAAYAISLMTYLGEDAIPWFPALAQCVGETNKLLSDMCAKALGSFARAYITGCGPPGFPQWARSPNWKVRLAAVRAFSDAGVANQQVVTILSDAAKDSHPEVSAQAVKALQAIEPKMHESIPLLISSLSDTNVSTVYEAAVTMGVFLIEPERCVPALSRAAGSTNWQVRCTAIYALGRFGPAARPASNVIFNALSDRQSDVRSSARDAMRLIEPEPLSK